MDRIEKSVSLSAPKKLGDDELAAVAGAGSLIDITVAPVTVVNTGLNVGVQLAVGVPGGAQQTLGQGISFGTGVSIH